MKLIAEGSCTLVVLGIVKGLKIYGDVVLKEIGQGNYKRILISITEEEVNGLRDFINHPYEIEMDDIELIYEYHIKNFGETEIPPAAFIRAIEFADRNKLDVKGIDIPSGQYEDMFVENVSIFDLIFLSLKKKKLIKRRWDFSSPERFSIEWDRYVNRGGYSKMEKGRERYMAERIAENLHENTIAIVDVERIEGITSILRNLLPEYKFQMSLEEMKVA